MPSHLMQASDSVTGEIYTWTSTAQDWVGAGYPGPNSPESVAVAAVAKFNAIGRITIVKQGAHTITAADWGGFDPAKTTLHIVTNGDLTLTLGTLSSRAMVICEARDGAITVTSSYGLDGLYMPTGDGCIMLSSSAASSDSWVLISRPVSLQFVPVTASRDATREDVGKCVQSKDVNDITLTIPGSTFRPGDTILVQRYDSGAMTIAASGAMNLRAPDGLVISDRYKFALITFTQENEAIVSGDLTS